MDDFWLGVAALDLADPESDDDFADEAGFDSEDEEDEEPESPEALAPLVPDVEPARLSVR